VSISRADLGVYGTVIAVTASAIVYIFTNFVTVSEFNAVTVELLYDQYWTTLDRISKARANGQTDYEQELARRLEELRAKICEVEPEWERCEK